MKDDDKDKRQRYIQCCSEWVISDDYCNDGAFKLKSFFSISFAGRKFERKWSQHQPNITFSSYGHHSRAEHHHTTQVCNTVRSHRNHNRTEYSHTTQVGNTVSSHRHHSRAEHHQRRQVCNTVTSHRHHSRAEYHHTIQVGNTLTDITAEQNTITQLRYVTLSTL